MLLQQMRLYFGDKVCIRPRNDKLGIGTVWPNRYVAILCHPSPVIFSDVKKRETCQKHTSNPNLQEFRSVLTVGSRIPSAHIG